MKKVIGILLAALMPAAMLFMSACGGKREVIDPDHKYPKQLTVQMISRDLYKEGGEPVGKDTIIDYFEKKFNVKFDLIYQPAPSQDEVFTKIGNSITTKKPSELYTIMPTRTDLPVARELYEGLVENDYIVNSKEFVSQNSERYPVLYELLNLNEVNTAEFQTVGGELAMIPRRFGTIDHGFIFRKDWLDNYNDGKVPTDYIELEQYLRIIKDKKPGGISQVGLTLPSTWWFSHIYSGFSGANMWALNDDGQYQYALAIDEHKDGLTWLNRLYTDHLLDRDVVTNKGEADAISDFVAGRSAVTMMGVTFGMPRIQKDMPGVEFEYAVIQGKRAPMRQFGSPYFEGAVVNKHFEDPARIYDMIEFILSEEGEEFLTFGIEGIHYTLDSSGEKIINYEKRIAENWERGRHPIANMFNVEPVLDETFTTDYAKIKVFIDSLNQPNATVKNPLIGVKTKAEEKRNPWDTVSEYNLGFIFGTKNLNNSWSEYLYELNRKGLTDIEKEINERFAPKA